MVKKHIWEIWMENEKKGKSSFDNYLRKEVIKIENEKENLSKSHIKKADSNLNFIIHLLNEKKFYDWSIVGCYYAIYHASLSLLAIKGYSSKNHLATLCSLIYLYYDPSQEDKLNKEDIELIAKTSIEKEEISYFVDAKNRRESASYGISEFNKQEAEELKEKTVLFINKIKQILEGK